MEKNELELYYAYLNQYLDIVKTQPSKEILKSMMSVIGEHDTSSTVNGTVTNGKGSDVTIDESVIVQTQSGSIQLNKNQRVETKTTYSTYSSKKKRVQKIVDKKGHCEFVMICDYELKNKRKFLIPADVFFDRAIFNDLNYTQSFTWNSDYEPKGKYAPNTELIKQYEIIEQ